MSYFSIHFVLVFKDSLFGAQIGELIQHLKYLTCKAAQVNKN